MKSHMVYRLNPHSLLESMWPFRSWPDLPFQCHFQHFPMHSVFQLCWTTGFPECDMFDFSVVCMWRFSLLLGIHFPHNLLNLLFSQTLLILALSEISPGSLHSLVLCRTLTHCWLWILPSGPLCVMPSASLCEGEREGRKRKEGKKEENKHGENQ